MKEIQEINSFPQTKGTLQDSHIITQEKDKIASW